MSSYADSQQIVRQPGGPLAPPPTLTVAGGDGAAGLGPADAWRIIKQRKWLVLITFILLYSLVVATTFIVYRYFPAYSSDLLLQLIPPKEDPLSISAGRLEPNVIKSQLETEARKLKSLDLVGRVLALPQVKQSEFYRWYKDDFPRARDELAAMLISAPIPESQLIKVSLSTRNRKDAKLILDELARLYLEGTRTEMSSQDRESLKRLKETLDALRRDLEVKQLEIARFRESASAPQLETERERTGYNISQLSLELSKLQVEAAGVQTQLNQLRSPGSEQAALTAEARIIIEADPVLRFWRQQVEALDIEIMVSRKQFGEGHRNSPLLTARRDLTYEKEVARREELIDELRNRQLETLTQRLAELTAQQSRLQEQLAEYEARQRDVDKNLLKFSTMQAEEQRLAREVEQVGMRVREAEHAARDAAGRAGMQLAQGAIEAVKPSRPDLVFYLGGGFVLALLGSVGLAFLRELTDTAVRTPLDLTRYAQVPVLGSIPRIDDEEADVEDIEHATRLAPNSLVAEAFRRVRTNLLFSGPPESQRCLLVTSPRPNDGKTAVAINLAVTLAQNNQRVLLIDCNFRRPAIRNAFANARAEGLCNILIGRGRLEDFVTRTELPNLDVLSSGPMPPNPADLLGSVYMRDLIAAALQRYDRVVLDGPPTLLITDALVLATMVDGVIMVARAVNSSRGALRRAREQLESINARVVGAILNGVQARPGGYFRQQYREFYEYTSEEQAPEELPGASITTTIGGDPPAETPPPDPENRPPQ